MRMNGLWTDGLVVMVLAGVCLTTGCRETPSDTRKTQTGTDSNEFPRLLELASSEAGSKGFGAMMRLRDIGDERTLPVVEAILNKHAGTGNIWEFGAAQALFCIGSEKAHSILAQHLLTDSYNAPQAIGYMFHWGMAQDKRDAFIAQYHLKSTSTVIAMKLTCESTAKDEQKFKFHILLSNMTDKPVTIYDPKVYLGRMLVISDPEGHFVQNLSNVEYGMPISESSFPQLPPGGQTQFTISAQPRIDSGSGDLVLDCGDVYHAIGKGGVFTAYGMYSVESTFADASTKRFGLSGLWKGRVVSEPVQIDIRQVGQ